MTDIWWGDKRFINYILKKNKDVLSRCYGVNDNVEYSIYGKKFEISKYSHVHKKHDVTINPFYKINKFYSFIFKHSYEMEFWQKLSIWTGFIEILMCIFPLGVAFGFLIRENPIFILPCIWYYGYKFLFGFNFLYPFRFLSLIFALSIGLTQNKIIIL